MALFKNVSVVWMLGGQRVKPGTPGAVQVRKESAKWYGKVKDGETGRWRNVPLSKDRGVAKKMLAKLEAEEDAARAGVGDPLKQFKGEDPRDYLPAFQKFMEEAGDGPRHIKDTAQRVRAILDGAGIKTMADLGKGYETVSDFITNLPSGPRTKNAYRQAIITFVKYLTKEKKRLPSNPYKELPVRPTPPAEARRKRRALSPGDLQKFVRAVQTRPLHACIAAPTRRKFRPGREAELSEERRKYLLMRGRGRALLYAFAAATGLREGENKVLLVRDCHLDGEAPFVKLTGERTKNGQDATLPITPEMAAALRGWIGDTGRGPDEVVFDVPGYHPLMAAWRKDLDHAGIPYRDEAGRYFDFHSLRKCLGSYLRLAGIDPAVSMKLLRHSDIRLTMQVYNDDELAQLAPVVNALPKMVI